MSHRQTYLGAATGTAVALDLDLGAVRVGLGSGTTEQKIDAIIAALCSVPATKAGELAFPTSG